MEALVQQSQVQARERKELNWPRALAALLLVLSAGTYLMMRFHVGIDDQVDKCLPPYTYFLEDLRARDFERGDLLVFMSDVRMAPYFRPGTIVIKRVVGMPGDHVTVDRHGAYLNGLPVADGLILARNLDKKPETFYRDEEIPEGAYWVAGDRSVPNSFDSRYWGYVRKNQILGKAYPLW